MVIDGVVELRTEEHVDLILNFLLDLFSVRVLLLVIERLGADEMRKEVLIPD